MADKKEQDGVIKRPTRKLSDRASQILGIICILFVMVCFIVRGFVGTDKNSESVPESQEIESYETKDYTFRNENLLNEHFEKHGDEFPYQTVEEYVAGANRVIASDDALHKLEAEDGDDVYYLEATNEFVIVSTDGYIRTYFKPSAGIDYFNRQ